MKLNILLYIGFNRAVGGEVGLYWNKSSENLCSLMHKVDGKYRRKDKI